jgi:hypothetical protein
MCARRRLIAVLIVVAAWPSAARAQVAISGEATVTLGSKDEIAYFNYTDYETNALRMFRLALAGMWRPTERLALLTEIRSENAENVVPYALYVRVRPFKGRAFDIQAGRIPPVFGAFARHSYGADGNPLIGYPLAYQYLTSLRPDAIPATADDLLLMRARGWRASYPVGNPTPEPGVPIVTAYRWDTGVQAHAAFKKIDAAVAVTRGTLANPRVEDDNHGRQIAGRIGYTPVVGLVVGASAADGEFLASAITDVYAPVLGDVRYAQRAFGIDGEYSRGYFMARGELVESRWNIPALNQPFIAGPLTAQAGFVEGRYRLTPRFFVAARGDRLTFSRITGERLFAGRPTPWDAPVTRVEAGGGVYVLRNLVARAVVQRNLRDAGRVTDRTFVSGQLSYWF